MCAISCPGIFSIRLREFSISDRQNERITFLEGVPVSPGGGRGRW